MDDHWFRLGDHGRYATRSKLMDNETLLWLDDERDPNDSRWRVYFPLAEPVVVWVKTYEQFVDWISINDLPNAICFDHDLGGEHSGFDAAKWLTEHCLDNAKPLPTWNIQSANPIGKQNIASLLRSFERATGNG